MDDGRSAFQEFLEDSCKTLKCLVLRNVALDSVGRGDPGCLSQEIQNRRSWGKIIDFMYDNLKLEEVRFERHLVSAAHFSWTNGGWNVLDRCKRQNLPLETSTTTDVDQLSLPDMHEEIYKICISWQIERYVLRDPAFDIIPCENGGLMQFVILLLAKTLLHLPADYRGGRSWSRLGYELCPYTGVRDYAFHHRSCGRWLYMAVLD